MRCSVLFLLGSATLSLTATAFAPIAPITAPARLAVSSPQQFITTHRSSTTSPSPSQLFESRNGRVDRDNNTPVVDYDALLKYHGAVVIQMSLIAGLFFALDTLVDITGIVTTIEQSTPIPSIALAVPLFYTLSLKSRVFNPLNNARPNMKQAIEQGSGDAQPPSRGFGDRIMPSWTPPGILFPIMWVLIIGPIRAYSSALVWQANGHHFLDPALLALVFHLSVGDVWNTMNNTEQRFGASVTGVLCVTASAVNVAYQYYTVDEGAGHLLGGLPMIWFAVAASLITATWQLNPTTSSGALEPRYPVLREQEDGSVSSSSITQFAWFGAAGSDTSDNQPQQ